MTDIEEVARLVAEAPDAARPAVAGLLRQVAHDLSTPVSTFSLEVFSARRVLEHVQAVGARGAGEQLELLREILENLECSTSILVEYAEALSQLANGDDETSVAEG